MTWGEGFFRQKISLDSLHRVFHGSPCERISPGKTSRKEDVSGVKAQRFVLVSPAPKDDKMSAKRDCHPQKDAAASKRRGEEKTSTTAVTRERDIGEGRNSSIEEFGPFRGNLGGSS